MRPPRPSGGGAAPSGTASSEPPLVPLRWTRDAGRAPMHNPPAGEFPEKLAPRQPQTQGKGPREALWARPAGILTHQEDGLPPSPFIFIFSIYLVQAAT